MTNETIETTEALLFDAYKRENAKLLAQRDHLKMALESLQGGSNLTRGQKSVIAAALSVVQS
jgi:hypothetical protein